MSSPLPRRISLLFGSAVLSLALYGCPGDLDPSLTGTGTGGTGGGVCDAPTMVLASTDLQKGCSNPTACHAAATHEAGLDLESAGVIGRLLGKAPDPASSVSCMSSTMQYLIAGTTPAQGLMIDKLNQTPSCGAPMPYPLGGIPAATKACLVEWANAVTAGTITQ